jgi:Domain of unknown function (DUF397)
MDLTDARWHTSSFSGNSGAGCVEVAFLHDSVGLRDTKDRTRAPHRYSAEQWAEFLAAVRAGRFTR